MPRDVIGACPLDCPDACSWVVTVDDEGRAVKLRGNGDHPHTRGGLCVKVNPYLEHSASPNRLLHPMRRVGPKGEGTFERISWDEALTLIAERITAAVERHGGETIWPFDGTGSVGYLQGGGAPARLWQVLGASHHHMGICSISGHGGMSYTTGTTAGMDPEDIVHAGIILLWGANTLTSNQHLWPFIEEARDAGAHVVAIDPVRTRTAARADEHLAPRPGTDAALALGLANVIVAAGGADEDFLERWALGWPEMRSHLAQYGPERVGEICDLPAERIVALGRRIAGTRPLAIKLGQGMQRHAGGGQAARVVSCLPAITGDYHRPGGGLVYSTSPAYGLGSAALARKDLRPGPVRTLSMTLLGRELERTDPPVTVLVVSAANPVVSNPDQSGVRRGLARDDLFTVVFDAFHTDTADYADLLLPTTLQTEHTEVMESFGHLYLNWNEPAVAPPGECVSRTDLLRRLAARLGRTEPELYATEEELAADLLSTPRWRVAGITPAVLRERGWVRVPGTRPYRPFAAGFPTDSGRFELVSERAERDGHGRLPDHRPPLEATSNGAGGAPALGGGPEGGFALLAPASHWHVNSVFAGEGRVRERSGAVEVTVCAKDAAELGLPDGADVDVGNERGSFRAVLRVGEVARPGVAVTTKGRWAKLSPGQTSVNATVAERDSDMLGGAVYHDNRVWITARR